MSWMDQIGYLPLQGMTFLGKVFFIIFLPLIFWRYGFSFLWPWSKGTWREFLKGASDEELERQVKRLDRSDLLDDVEAELRRRRRSELKRQQQREETTRELGCTVQNG